jgi:uncharacterized protein DUF3443
MRRVATSRGTTNNRTNNQTNNNNHETAITSQWLRVVACGALLFACACGGSSRSTPTSTPSPTPTPTPTGSNVQAIQVNSGPQGANYANGAFTSVTVCVPGTSTCQTIDEVLVDTGSSGLRLLASALTIPLPQQTSSGSGVYECLPFVIGYTWGPVQTADIEMASEKASSVPIQVISGSPPSSSQCNPAEGNSDTVITLGANGIVGVGMFPQDCGDGCTTAGSSDLYYACPSSTSSSSCVSVAESLAQQVQNPVALFATDNNGVIIELPAVTAPEATLSGSLVFGIGTQSNNGLNGAAIYPIAPSGPNTGNFTTTFNGKVYDQSFIDSGSNGFFFPSSIPPCPDPNNDFYCPSLTENLSATNAGYAGTPTGAVNFSVANADDLFNDNPNATVFGQLAGPSTIDSFDWGLPFFYGRNVFTAIYGSSTPGGTGPYWAY